MKALWCKPAGLIYLAIGTVLLVLNLWGLAEGIAVADKVPEEQWHFENDLSLTYNEAMAQLKRVDASESQYSYASRANTVIQKTMVHLTRWLDPHPDEFKQRVPFTENIYLHLMGRFSGLPQIERYHFVNYKRSLKRGIGICGDHTMILSQVLDLNGIDNSLLAFDGHVLAEVRFEDGSTHLFDPDFGVSINMAASDVPHNIPRLREAYLESGYAENDVDFLMSIYEGGFHQFDSTYTFMRKRYVFEYATYVLKWLLPAL